MGANKTLMVSVMRAVLAAFVCGVGCTSCASFQKEKSGAELRKEGYEALLRTVKPGMYRRQLYAVLPPHETPLSVPPLLMAVAYTGSTASPLFRPHMECHFMDEECYAVVFYQLENGSEYGLRDIAPRHGTMPDSIDFAPSKLSDWIPFGKGKSPSKENPDDIVLDVSPVHLTRKAPDRLQIPATASPLQEEGKLFGRKIAIEPGADSPLPMAPSPEVEN